MYSEKRGTCIVAWQAKFANVGGSWQTGGVWRISAGVWRNIEFREDDLVAEQNIKQT